MAEPGTGTRRGGGSAARVFDATGFWDGVRQRPFDRREWLEAERLQACFESH